MTVASNAHSHRFVRGPDVVMRPLPWTARYCAAAALVAVLPFFGARMVVGHDSTPSVDATSRPPAPALDSGLDSVDGEEEEIVNGEHDRMSLSAEVRWTKRQREREKERKKNNQLAPCRAYRT